MSCCSSVKLPHLVCYCFFQDFIGPHSLYILNLSLLKRLHVYFMSLSRSRSQKPCVSRCLHWSSQSCCMQAAISVRVLFYHSLAVGLGLHFFVTCSLVYIIAVKRADTVFLRSVVKIGLFVSISTFRSPQRCFRISTKAMNYIFLLVSFILYLFPQQLLIEITLLNRVHYMARQSESKANSGLIVQLDRIAC